MSKSLKNFITIKQALEENSSRQVRFERWGCQELQ